MVDEQREGNAIQITLAQSEDPIRMSGGCLWVVQRDHELDRWIVLNQRTRTKPDGSPIPRPLLLDVSGGIWDDEFMTWWGLMAGEAAEFCIVKEAERPAIVLPEIDESSSFGLTFQAELIRTARLAGLPHPPGSFSLSMMSFTVEGTVGYQLQTDSAIFVEENDRRIEVVMAIEPDNFALEPRIILLVQVFDWFCKFYDLEGAIEASDTFRWLKRPILLVDIKTGAVEHWKNGGLAEKTTLTEVIAGIEAIPPDQRDNRICTEKVEACVKALPFPTPGLAPLLSKS